MCSKALTKFILIIFNVVFVLLGIVILGIGLYSKFDSNGLAGLLSKIPHDITKGTDIVDIPALINSASLAFIIGGAFILVVGFLGCCGAWKEVSCFLIVYALVLVLLIIIEFAFVIMMYTSKSKVEDHLSDFMSVTIHRGYKGGTGFSNKTFSLTKDATTLAWDMTQFSLECCGVRGIDDYSNASKWDHKVDIVAAGGVKTVHAIVPMSCCQMVDPSKFPKQLGEVIFKDLEDCLTNPTQTNANTKGCYRAVEESLMQYFNISVGVAVGIAILEICGLICACWLYKSLQKNKGYEQQQ